MLPCAQESTLCVVSSEVSLLEHETNVLTAEKFCFDADNNIYYTPAFRKTNSCYTAGLGIGSMIYALKLRFL